MANKVVKIPVSDIDGLQQTGYLFRYRIKSKDGSRTSEWSPITKLLFPLNPSPATTQDMQLSFYERVFGDTRPNLSGVGGVDPHPTVSYSVATVSSGVTNYINSNITSSGDGTGLYTVTWNEVPSTVRQSFDVYLSWRTNDSAGPVWNTSPGNYDWYYAGTTNTNSFTFKRPSVSGITHQYVQAAIYLSSYPKLTNIYNQEVNFVSITPVFTTYYNTGPATVSAWTQVGTTGVYTATVTGLDEVFPSQSSYGKQFFNAKVFGSLALDAHGVTIKSRTSDTSIVIESKSSGTLPTGTVNAFRLA